MGDENSNEPLTVKQVCELTMATPAQLRYWDKAGLLVPKRSGDFVANNRKLYTQEDVQKIREILLYKHLGFKLKEIEELFKAPKAKRESLAAERNRSLREEFNRVGKKISLSSAMEILDANTLVSEAEMLGGYGPLEDEYEQNENLKMLARWIRSHGERDRRAFAAELRETVSGFKMLGGFPEWPDVERQLVGFCDMWSKRFGWPTLGQMYLLSRSFREIDDQIEDVYAVFGEGDLEFISNMFYLAWISGSLEGLDKILVSFYFAWMELDRESLDDFEMSAKQLVDKTSDLLCAFLGEIGNNHPLFDEVNRSGDDQIERIAEIAHLLLHILEDAALDECIEGYLRLEDFVAVSGDSLRLAKDMLDASLASRVARWLSDAGYDEIDKCISEWIDALQTVYMRERLAGDSNVFAKSDADVDDEEVSRFFDWIQDYYAYVLNDPPEAKWATEDENRAKEKANRELLDDA